MISTRKQKIRKPTPRRLMAMAATLLFALCVLITSAPHRHGDGERTSASSRHAATMATVHSDTACALCDWLYAPTLPAAAPVLPPVTRLLRPSVLELSVPAQRLLSFEPSRSSSRAPPAV